MKIYTYRIRLCKDAEPGTGLGGESTNDLIPRDAHGLPILPASHIKGLMRAALKEIAAERAEWGPFLGANERQSVAQKLIERVFGREQQEVATEESTLHFSNAELPLKGREKRKTRIPTKTVSRTALEENGTALEASLRTSEVLAKGTVFEGRVFSQLEDSSLEAVAWKLALLSITAIGGSRSRTGQVMTEFAVAAGNVTPSPGELLVELDRLIRTNPESRTLSPPVGALTSSMVPAQQTAIIELLFVAESPICCPEQPDKTNVITSGFTIPASTVQGILLHRINRQNPGLADQLFSAVNFRCWPLNPCANPQDERTLDVLDRNPMGWLDELPYSMRVSLSHRAAKFSKADYSTDHFFDEAFHGPEPVNPDNAPLKAADGVLLFGDGVRRIRGTADASRLLWKSAHMPRHLSTHGVMDGPRSRTSTKANGRNLYSVEAMAPLIWRGQVAVPENLADLIVKDFEQQPYVHVGKARTVRGLGRIIARRVAPADGQGLVAADYGKVLVLQSPVEIPEGWYAELTEHRESAEEILRRTAQRWLAHHHLPDLSADPNVWANAGIRFGWNRTIGTNGSSPGFQKAVPVLLPGTVFTLTEVPDPTALRTALVAGFSAEPGVYSEVGKSRAFGALAAHPGVAEGLYVQKQPIRMTESTSLREAMKVVMTLSESSHLPSPSQIRAVEQRILGDQKSLQDARSYLEDQCKRIIRVWHDWEPVYNEVHMLLTRHNPADAKAALSTLADMAVSRLREGKEKS